MIDDGAEVRPIDAGRYVGRRMDLAGLLAKPPRPQRWRVANFAQDGTLTILSGAAGDGKSWLALAMAYGVQGGEKIAGMDCTQGRAVVFDGEMGAEMYADRLRSAGLKAEVPVFDCMGLDLCREDDRSWMRQTIRNEKANLVVIDSLRRLVPSASENDSDDMAPAVAWLAHAARGTRAAVVLVHHKGDGPKLYRGSSAIRDQCDALFGLLRPEESEDATEGLRCLTCRGGSGKMRYAPEPADHWLSIEPRSGVVVVPADTPSTTTTPRRTRKDQMVDALIPLVTGDPELGRSQAAEALDVDPANQNVRIALAEARERVADIDGGEA